ARAGISEETTDILVEAANFDGTAVRRAAQALKLFTDASTRFQNRPSPELAAYAMRDVLALIQKVAGGELGGVTDVQVPHTSARPIALTLSRINGLLGASFSREEIANAFGRLGFS